MLSDTAVALDYCYLTTTGRKTGQPREIEIWFAAEGDILYLLAGGGENSHWVQNIRASASVSVRIGADIFAGHGRIVSAGTSEDRQARSLVFEKYQSRYSGDLSNWRDTALPVAIDLR